MKYHKGQCEVCANIHMQKIKYREGFVCFADTGQLAGYGVNRLKSESQANVVFKRLTAKNKCKYFKKKEILVSSN